MVTLRQVNQKLPKDHHYIPQFYLNKFSNDPISRENKRVYVLDKERKDEEIKFLPIKRIAFQKNFYTYRTKENSRETLEDMFSIIERAAAKIIKKIEQEKELTIEDRNGLSLFLSLLYLRVPFAKKQFEESTKSLYETIVRKTTAMTSNDSLKAFFKKQGKVLTDEEIDDMKNFAVDEKRSKIEVDIPQEFWIKMMLKLSVKITPALEITDWEFRIAEKPFAYITSDNPFLLVPGRKMEKSEGLGLLTPDAKKIVPLTSKICLIMHEPKEEPITVYSNADKQFYNKINRWVLRHSSRFAYSADRGKIEKMIKLEPELLKPMPKTVVVSS